MAYVTDIANRSRENERFREVLYTGAHTQLVVMSLRPGEDIGLETHAGTDQFIRVESGTGIVVLNGTEYRLEDGVAVVVPSGTEHNVVNTSSDAPLKLYTLYSPPEHSDATIHDTRDQAMEDETTRHP